MHKAISPFAHEVQHLTTHNATNAHHSRLKLYADSSLEVGRDLENDISHKNPPLRNIVEQLLGLRFNDEAGCFEVQTKWQGFDYEDPAWEPSHALKQGIPAMTTEFLSKFPNRALAEAAMKI